MHVHAHIKATAWVAVLATVFVLLFSELYISHHIDHDCTGEDCPICAEISQCINNLKTIGATVIVCTFVFLSVRIIRNEQNTCSVCISDSLISRKVRMNN